MQINLPNSFFELGDQRKFKYLINLINNKEEVINFFITKLNYKKHEINKVAYDVNYRKQRYQIYKLNKLSNPHIAS